MLGAAHAVEAEVEAKLNAIGLSAAKLAALRALDEAGESLPLSELAGRLSCVKSNITQLVDRLESDGFVARTPAPNDRRTTLAALTRAGRQAVKDGVRAFETAEREVLGRLSPGEVRQLRSLLKKVAP